MAAQPAGAEPDRLDPRDEVGHRQALFREIEQLLSTGFTGTITLHCHKGGVPRYTVRSLLPGAGRRGPWIERMREPGRGQSLPQRPNDVD